MNEGSLHIHPSADTSVTHSRLVEAPLLRLFLSLNQFFFSSTQELHISFSLNSLSDQSFLPHCNVNNHTANLCVRMPKRPHACDRGFLKVVICDSKVMMRAFFTATLEVWNLRPDSFPPSLVMMLICYLFPLKKIPDSVDGEGLQHSWILCLLPTSLIQHLLLFLSMEPLHSI